METNQYLCKDCKHSRRTITRVLAHGFFSKYALECKISYKEANIENDPVIGPIKHKAEYQACALYRVREDDCGSSGKYWQPKEKKDLFKLIQKEANL